MKKLNVLGAKVSVSVRKCEIDGHVGEYDSENQTIRIDPQYTQKTHTYFHEVGHPLYKRMGLEQAIRDARIEEMFCDMFANFMEDNIVTLYQTYCKLKKIK